jgi:hypothetical protein
MLKKFARLAFHVLPNFYQTLLRDAHSGSRKTEKPSLNTWQPTSYVPPPSVADNSEAIGNLNAALKAVLLLY